MSFNISPQKNTVRDIRHQATPEQLRRLERGEPLAGATTKPNEATKDIICAEKAAVNAANRAEPAMPKVPANIDVNAAISRLYR